MIHGTTCRCCADIFFISTHTNFVVVDFASFCLADSVRVVDIFVSTTETAEQCALQLGALGVVAVVAGAVAITFVAAAVIVFIMVAVVVGHVLATHPIKFRQLRCCK